MRVAPDPALGRLLKRSDFLAAARGRRFHTGHLTVQSRRRDADAAGGSLRVGFTVTKREGHATERNRIRRRLRAAVAEVASGAVDLPVDVVVIGRRAALAAPYTVLLDDLARAVRAVTRQDRGAPRGRAPSRPDPC